jgi:hypothetical protein
VGGKGLMPCAVAITPFSYSAWGPEGAARSPLERDASSGGRRRAPGMEPLPRVRCNSLIDFEYTSAVL